MLTFRVAARPKTCACTMVLAATLVIFEPILARELGPDTASGGSRLPTVSTADQYAAHYKRYLNDLPVASQKSDLIAHRLATTSLLKLIDSATIRAQLPLLRHLHESIQQYGTEPYLAIGLRIAHRLGRNSHPRYQREFRRMVSAARAPAEPAVYKRPQNVLVQDLSGRHYRLYDLAFGRALVDYSLTAAGYRQFRAGQRPSDLLRTMMMWRECASVNEASREQTKAARRVCDLFAATVDARLSIPVGRGSSRIPGFDIAPGISVRSFDCFEKGSAVLVDEVEKAAACQIDSLPTPDSWRRDGSSVATTELSNWGDRVPQVEGYTYQGTKEWASRIIP